MGIASVTNANRVAATIAIDIARLRPMRSATSDQGIVAKASPSVPAEIMSADSDVLTPKVVEISGSTACGA